MPDFDLDAICTFNMVLDILIKCKYLRSSDDIVALISVRYIYADKQAVLTLMEDIQYVSTAGTSMIRKPVHILKCIIHHFL